MESSLPRRTSRTAALQDRQDQQEQQHPDVNADPAKATHGDQATVSGRAVVVVGGRGDAHAPATGTAEQDSDDEDDDDNNDDDDGDDDERGDLPMSMTASVILTSLPKDASEALKEVEEWDDRKGTCL